MTNHKTEMKDIAENLEHCQWLTLRLMTAMIDEEIGYSDFEFNMQQLACKIDNEQIRLQAIIDSLPCDKEGKLYWNIKIISLILRLAWISLE